MNDKLKKALDDIYNKYLVQNDNARREDEPYSGVDHGSRVESHTFLSNGMPVKKRHRQYFQMSNDGGRSTSKPI